MQSVVENDASTADSEHESVVHFDINHNLVILSILNLHAFVLNKNLRCTNIYKQLIFKKNLLLFICPFKIKK